jgi:sugar/nucleoside kinase (ribokinase family)
VEQAIAAASAWGTQLVVTRGADGALVSLPDGSFTQVREGVREVVVKDLTGAGDNFAGALIAALLGGASITEAVIAANEAGSRAVGQLGAIGSVGAATSSGWPFRPIDFQNLTSALTTVSQPELMERG